MRLRTAFLLLLLVVAGLAFLARRGHEPEIRATLSATRALEVGGDGFERALEPRPFEFPQDHGPHPRFRSEWWYFTGNLQSVGASPGRPFGFQLTFFRSSLSPSPVDRPSAWGSDQLAMAHFALSDLADKRFHAFDRFSRMALGLAGAQAEPFRVWLRDWQAASADPSGSIPPIRLQAAEGEVALDLRLDPGKPIVLHGDRGLSQKSAEPGNASYYYSFTRLPTEGEVRIGNQRFEVRGHSWMDREWSTSVLRSDQTGWDWFSLQLADGRELMLFELRSAGGGEPVRAGTVVAADGSARTLSEDGFRLEVLDRWRSPHSGVLYPSRWRLELPADGLDLEIRPRMADQELNVAFRYWEGSVEVAGTSAGQPIAGLGYAELTGYDLQR